MKLRIVIAGVFVGLAATACSTVGHAATQAGTAPASHTASVSSASGGQARGSSAATSAHVATASTGTTSTGTTSPATTSTSTTSTAPSGGTTVHAKPVVFDCLNNPVVAPSSYVFTCADYGSALYYLKWMSWTSVRATGVGVHELNDCTPNCAEGTFHKYPAVVTFWRPEPLAGHPGEKYFTRVTVRYTGPRPPMYMSYGQLVKNPASWTEILGS